MTQCAGTRGLPARLGRAVFTWEYAGGTSTSAGKREEKFPEPDVIHLAGRGPVRPGPPHVRHARRTSSPTRLAGGDQPPARAPVDPIALLRRAALQLRTSARTLRRRRRHLSSPLAGASSPNRAKVIGIFSTRAPVWCLATTACQRRSWPLESSLLHRWMVHSLSRGFGTRWDQEHGGRSVRFDLARAVACGPGTGQFGERPIL